MFRYRLMFFRGDYDDREITVDLPCNWYDVDRLTALARECAPTDGEGWYLVSITSALETIILP